jgi:transcriptional regulator with XRE-family HTH domain
MMAAAADDARRPTGQEPEWDTNRQPHKPADPDVEDAVEVALRYLDNPVTAREIPDDAPHAVRVLLQALAAARHDEESFDHLTKDLETPAAPLLSEDPLAVALGLAPQETPVLAGTALKAARQHAGLKVAALAQRLTAAGHSVKAGQLMRWEIAKSVPIEAGVLSSIARILHVDEAQLRAAKDQSSSLALSTQFRDLARRFSRVTGLDFLAAQTLLLAKNATTARRGSAYDDEHSLAALTAFVESRERSADQERR